MSRLEELLEWLGPCEHYTRSDCRGNGRGPRDSQYGAERWCAPCEVRDRLPVIAAEARGEAIADHYPSLEAVRVAALAREAAEAALAKHLEGQFHAARDSAPWETWVDDSDRLTAERALAVAALRSALEVVA